MIPIGPALFPIGTATIPIGMATIPIAIAAIPIDFAAILEVLSVFPAQTASLAIDKLLMLKAL